MKSRWRNLLVGMGSIFNLGGTPPISPLSGAEAVRLNEKALADDWSAVGGDMRRAVVALEEEKKKRDQESPQAKP